MALIAFLPMAREIAAVPLLGLPTLGVVFVAVLATRGGAHRYPGMAVAVIVGKVLLDKGKKILLSHL